MTEIPYVSYMPQAPTEPSPSLLKKEAKGVLYDRGRLLRLSLLGILLLFALGFPYLMGGYLFELLYLTGLLGDSFFVVEMLPYLMMLPLAVLVSAPALIYGMRAARQVIDGEVPGRVTYGRALRCGLCLYGRTVLCTLPMTVIWSLPVWTVSTPLAAVMWLFRLLATAAGGVISALLLYVSRRFFYLSYFAAEGRTLREAFGASGKAKRAYKPLYRRFFGTFAGLLALSVVSIGVLFILYVLPLMTVTYCLGLRRLSEENGI